ncbi:MAG: hypothetical protein FWF59_01530 [Turicibacter sp.]|nr:hypothetical protein [Turicibacter sp.]
MTKIGWIVLGIIVLPTLLGILMILVMGGLPTLGIGGDQPQPVIREGEFTYRLVYELDGEWFEYEGVIIASFAGLDYSNAFDLWNRRSWRATAIPDGSEITLIRQQGEPSTLTPNRENIRARVAFLWANSGGWFLGDPAQSHMAPYFLYSELYHTTHNNSPAQRSTSTRLNERQLQEHFGIRIIELYVGEPITNQFE